MPWEAVFWSLALIISPIVASQVWPRMQDRFGDWREPLEVAAPWLHSLLLPYLALLTGSIIGRDAGLYGHSLSGWASGAIACGLGFAAAAFVLRTRPTKLPWSHTLSEALREEPRWAMYRASAALWVTPFPLSVAIGTALAFTETAVWVLQEEKTRRLTLANGARILRALFSGLLFGLTRNFWLTAATQAAIAVLFTMPRSKEISKSNSQSLSA
ncbi:MAG: hypothetical protein KAR65_10555 [Anaerolineales bacterium]|nr:hypothetical protein [Anaerolineales bacterium]MCK5634737.1 hypothetical protein [Anaerolineales bacterium]